MKKSSSLTRIVVLLFVSILIFSVNGCIKSNSSPHSRYVQVYQSVLDQRLADAVLLRDSGFDEDWIASKLQFALGNMKAENLAQRIQTAYADDLFFNDTWHTHSSVAELASYMERIVSRVEMLDITIDGVAINQQDAYVRWRMSFKTQANAQAVHSIGMTHLRFNADGKIILHQDYWDGVEGFYRTLPIIGWLLETIKRSI